MTNNPPDSLTDVDTPDVIDGTPPQLEWMGRKEARARLEKEGFKLSLRGLLKLEEADAIIHKRITDGPYGEQVMIEYNSLRAHAAGGKPVAKIHPIHADRAPTELAPEQNQSSSPPQPSTDLVPLMDKTIDRLMDQVSVLHSAGEELGRAKAERDSTAKALAEANTKNRELETALAEALAAMVPPTSPGDVEPAPAHSDPEPPAPERTEEALRLTGGPVPRRVIWNPLTW